MPLKIKGGQFTSEARAYRAVQRELALMYQMRTPQGLSLRAQWMELRIPECHPWDWWHLFNDDKELWPFILDEARDEYGKSS